MLYKHVHNVATGEVTLEPLTEQELAQRVIDEQAEIVRLEQEQAKINARQALLDRLGITENEAQLLLGGN